MLNVNEEHIDRISETFHLLARGKKTSRLTLPDDHPDDEIRQAFDYINKFVEAYETLNESMFTLSRGDLDFETPGRGLASLQSLKNLQSNLRHLTWKTQQIAKGDFTHRIDFMGDFSAAFNSMATQLKEAFDKIEAQRTQLATAYEIIQEEKRKSDDLLLNILPEPVADELKRTGSAKPESFEGVTILFSDLVGFTDHSSRLTASELIGELNELFTAYDGVIERHDCERIKTIGDAYLAVCGMPDADPDHARKMVDAALEIVDYLRDRAGRSRVGWQARIGIHSGSVVGGVVGVKKYIYDVFGDAINTASRMESHSEPMRVNVSESTRKLLDDRYAFTDREPIEVKGKGQMAMSFVESKK